MSAENARNLQALKSAAAMEKALDAALDLFSRQGFRATSMRQIATASGFSLGNLYHHFRGKEEIFNKLLETYWQSLSDPDLPLNRLFLAANFPDDLEEIAREIKTIVREKKPYILLIYIDVIEFQGKHLREFYGHMPRRFAETYQQRFDELRRQGKIGDVDPMVAVMTATRWIFYFYTVEQCFGVPMHFGMDPDDAVKEFIRILRLGLDPRGPAPGLARGSNPS